MSRRRVRKKVEGKCTGSTHRIKHTDNTETPIRRSGQKKSDNKSGIDGDSQFHLEKVIPIIGRSSRRMASRRISLPLVENSDADSDCDDPSPGENDPDDDYRCALRKSTSRTRVKTPVETVPEKSHMSCDIMGQESPIFPSPGSSASGLVELTPCRWTSLETSDAGPEVETASCTSSDPDRLVISSNEDRFILDLDQQTPVSMISDDCNSIDSQLLTPSTSDTNVSPGSSSSKGAKRNSVKSKLIALSTGKSTTGKSTRQCHQCPTCDKTMSSRSDLVKHMRTHTGEKPYACNKCDARFTQLGSLRAHETRHTGVKPFVCQICSRAFSIRERLKVHMRVHTGVKPFHCKLCDKSFARGSQLIQHRRVHTGDKPYACSYCDMKFAFATNLKLHEKKHTGAKDFECPRCFKGFVRQDALRRHILSYHENERPMRCPICDKTFKGHLGTHLRVHTQERPFQCDQCPAAFAQNSQLTVHQRIHTGDRPYACQVCSHKFAHSTALKVHLRQHTGEKPYRCPLCGTTFNQLPHLKKHLRTIHRQPQPYMCGACKKFFKTKGERQRHIVSEHKDVPLPRGAEFGVVDHVRRDITEPETSAETVTRGGVPVSRLRAHLAILLNKISSKQRLTRFGFGKRLIDNVLHDSLEDAGRCPVMSRDDDNDDGDKRQQHSADEALRVNIQLLLDWTVPAEFMEQYKRERRTVEEILEELAS